MVQIFKKEKIKRERRKRRERRRITEKRMKHRLIKLTNKTEKISNKIQSLKAKERIELFNLLNREGFKYFNNLVALSKASRKIFITASKLRTIDRGLGISIIKTSKGFMTSEQARLLNLGGELIFKIT